MQRIHSFEMGIQFHMPLARLPQMIVCTYESTLYDHLHSYDPEEENCMAGL